MQSGIANEDIQITCRALAWRHVVNPLGFKYGIVYVIWRRASELMARQLLGLERYCIIPYLSPF